jgi:hypothetical protein
VYPTQWQSFSAYRVQVANSLVTEATAYEAERLKAAGKFAMPLDGPRLRRAANAVADAASLAAAPERGRRARPLHTTAKAAAKAARFGNGKQSAAVLHQLALRVQKVAHRLQHATAGMETDPTAARKLADEAWMFAKGQEVVADVRTKADRATELRIQAEKRAALMRECGRMMTVARCGACGEYAAGTGELVKMHCHARACPCCARGKSGQDFHELRDAMKAVPKHDGYEWRLVELTFRRNPSDARLHTVDALCDRTEALFRTSKHLWDTHLARKEGTAMYAKVECSGTGNVHAHLVVYAPFLPKPLLESIIRQVKGLPRGIDHGFTWIDLAKTDEEAIAAEATKYVTKSHSPMAEDWLAGDPREVMYPALAARWEIATMGAALSRTYGALRGAEAEEEETDEQEPEESRLPDHCEHCGVIGEMHMVTVETEPTVAAMHAKGMRALFKSRWAPKVKLRSHPLLVEMQRKHNGDVVVLHLRDLRWGRHDGWTVVPRAEVTGGLFDDNPCVRADTIAPLHRPAADGATWVLSFVNKERMRVRLEQVVFDAAA